MKHLTRLDVTTSLITVLALASCAHESSNLSQRDIGEGLRQADQFVVVYVVPPNFYLPPPRTIGQSMMGVNIPVVFAAGLISDAVERSSQAKARTKGDSAPLRLVAALDVVDKAVLSRLQDRVRLAAKINGPFVVPAPDKGVVEKYVHDLRTERFPAAPLLSFQIDSWGLSYGDGNLYRIRYRASAKIYLPQHPLPVWWKDCLIVPNDNTLTAERDAYLANGGALLNQHLRTAAERCGEELARELASLELP
jgi:hypothetical protein